ncbi:dynamin-related protein 3A-like [Solanum pennellii]|uniref:Dynamin-related protein 3A-like n=1 Tax=Solanum pennellii TaxID=28526 RepID=A0ABM1VGF0_SOLPN|nr:dynamin-related protein 3A-like [Solanum pennellii]
MEMDYISTSHQMAPTILVQHFKTLLPGLKSYISTVLVTAAKEHASYGEIMESKIIHHCMVNEFQQFPILRKCMIEVIGKFLREGLGPSEVMIGHIIEIEVCQFDTSLRWRF